MARRDIVEISEDLPPPAKTLEGRNDQLIALAFELAEERLRNKSASAQEVVHFLKMGSTKEGLEREKLRKENLMLETRVKDMESKKSSEEIAAKALAAMRTYQGIEAEEGPGSADVF